jgi:hypothetical protein
MYFALAQDGFMNIFNLISRSKKSDITVNQTISEARKAIAEAVKEISPKE